MSVDAFAKVIIDLHKRGALESVLSVPEQKLELAKVLGSEWLGADHPIVECLNIGVAVHHGALPTPFRKEIEKLLREGVLKITVSSPTLAQGLNLAATAVIIYSLTRNRKRIDASEFKNVVGRAGRAFVDTHGLVLHPIFDNHHHRQEEWRELVEDADARNMESGLIRLVASFLSRLATSLQMDLAHVTEYVVNNAAVWQFPLIEGETDAQVDEQRATWNNHLVSLDTALLSLLGDEEISIDEIPDALDLILQSSLWQRRLNRYPEAAQVSCNSILVQRGRYIWNSTTAFQRKGYFLAGVGLETGQRLDAISQQANVLLINANGYILANSQELAIQTITSLAELLFDTLPFVPRVLPVDWQDILEAWLKGEMLTEGAFSDIDEALKFIEEGLIYRLPWGMEAIRVRALANEEEIVDGTTIDDYELGLVVPAVENGTLNRSAAMLMQAGFNSRQAAIYAVNSTDATFSTGREFKAWLSSDLVNQHTLSAIWPTPATATLWQAFLSEYQPTSETTWGNENDQTPVNWILNHNPHMGAVVKLWNGEVGPTNVISSDGEKIGVLPIRYNLLSSGVYSSVVAENHGTLEVSYWGTGSAPFEHADLGSPQI